MKRLFLFAPLALISFHSFAADIAGKWSGALRIGAIELRVLFHVDACGDGYTGTMDSIDQGATGIPLSAIRVDGDQVVFESARVAGTFTGTLAGDGERRARIEALVRRQRLDDRVRFLGNVSDIRPVIAASDATVLASTAVETFSMAMLESMAMGVPMIAPDIGGLAEAIVHRETGLLFPVGDVGELTSCMRMFVDKSLDVMAIGRAAEQQVSRRFTVDQMVSANERILQGTRQSDFHTHQN